MDDGPESVGHGVYLEYKSRASVDKFVGRCRLENLLKASFAGAARPALADPLSIPDLGGDRSHPSRTLGAEAL